MAISTKRYDDSIPLPDDGWKVGGVPEDSFVSPWSLHSPRLEDIDHWQGRVGALLLEHVTGAVVGYLGR